MGSIPIFCFMRRVSQAVKTLPFQGGNMGSIPIRAIIMGYRITEVQRVLSPYVLVRFQLSHFKSEKTYQKTQHKPEKALKRKEIFYGH